MDPSWNRSLLGKSTVCPPCDIIAELHRQLKPGWRGGSESSGHMDCRARGMQGVAAKTWQRDVAARQSFHGLEDGAQRDMPAVGPMARKLTPRVHWLTLWDGASCLAGNQGRCPTQLKASQWPSFSQTG
jgi:hypothetical protein